MTMEQVLVAKAHTNKTKKGLLNLTSEDANVLYNTGRMTKEEATELKEYHEAPIRWYAKDIAKQVMGGARDFTQETLETMDWFNKNSNVFAQAIKAFGPDEMAKDVTQWQESDKTTIKLPSIDKSESDVGKATRGISQFLTGFIPVFGQVSKAQSIGNMAKGAIAGGIVDFVGFDEHEKNLSNMTQEIPALQNPVSEFLSNKGDDSLVVGKIKNTVDGLVTGLAFDGLIQGLKVVRSNIHFKANGTDDGIRNEVEALVGKTKPVEASEVTKGATEEPKVKPTEGTVKDTPTETPQVKPKEDVDVHNANVEIHRALDETKPMTDRIVDDSDFETLLQKSIEADTKHIPAQTHEATRILAEEFKEDFKTVFKTADDLEGMAQRVVHARNIVESFAEQLHKETEMFLDPTKRVFKDLDEAHAYSQVSDEVRELELYYKIVQHGALQKTLKGISANIGRALNAHKIKVGAKEVDLTMAKPQEIQEVIDAMGGRKNIRKAIETFHALKGKPKLERNLFTKSLSQYRVSNFLYGGWISGILSGGGTQVANILGNSSNILLGTLEHAMAMTGRSIANGDASHMLEVSARFKGMSQGLLDAFRVFSYSDEGFKLQAGNFWKALGDNAPVLDAKIKIEDSTVNNMPTLFSKGFKSHLEELNKASLPMKIAGYGARITGDILTLPLRFLSATDEAFKSVVYRGDLHRQAIELANKEGMRFPTKEARENFIKTFADNPTKIQHDLALEKAREMTFTSSIDATNRIGEEYGMRRALSSVGTGVDIVAKAVTDMKHSNSALVSGPMKLLVPFVTTPLNIAKTVGRKTPLAVFSRKFHEDLLAGGSRRAEAYARLVTGTGIIGATYAMYENGMIVGKIPPHLKETYALMNIPEYSIRIGNEHISYNRLDPLGMLLGLTADIMTAIDTNEVKPEEEQKLYQDLAVALTNNVINKTYMQGIGNIVNAMNSPNEKRFSTWANNTISSALPFSSAIGQYTASNDEFQREAKTLSDYFAKKLDPKSLLPKLNIFGEPITRIPKYMMSIEHNEASTDRVVKEMFKVGVNIKDMDETLTHKGVNIKLTPEQHNRMKELVGETGIKKHLEKLLKSKEYNKIEDFGVRRKIIQDSIYKARDEAKVRFIKENKDVFKKIESDLKDKRARIFNKDKASKANELYHPIPALKDMKGL